MKISITIIVILLLSSLFDKNQENMKIVEYTVDELNDKKLFMIIDSLNVVSANDARHHILIYQYSYDSCSSKICHFPDYKKYNGIESYKSEHLANFTIFSNLLEKKYHNKVFERMCFVEGGSIEYFVLLKNSKIVSCFISDGFSWDKSSSDKRLKTFNELYPKIIEVSSEQSRNNNGFVFIDGKKVILDSITSDSLTYKMDSSYRKNKTIKRSSIERVDKEDRSLMIKNIDIWDIVNKKESFFKSKAYHGKSLEDIPSDFLRFYNKFISDSIYQKEMIDLNTFIGLIIECDSLLVLDDKNWNYIEWDLTEQFSIDQNNDWTSNIYYNDSLFLFENVLDEVGVMNQIGFERVLDRWMLTFYIKDNC